MSIVKTSDFESGRFEIPLNPVQEVELQAQIDYVESVYLRNLFGLELYDLFIADLVSDVPQSARFLTVFNPLQFQDCLIYISEGIKQMLMGIIYFYYVREANRTVTTVGVKSTLSANSDNVPALHSGITNKYNEGIETYAVIQYYMIENSATYPEYEGIKLDSVSLF